MIEKSLNNLILMVSILALLGCNLQNNMLYYPSSYVPSPDLLAAENIKFWPSSREDYRGFVSTAPTKEVKGTIVVFHGNAGTAADRAYYVQALAPLGYRVILAEYPGYGGRKGDPGERVFAADAKETVRLASEKYGRPVFLIGESLGCAVAAAAAKEIPVQIDGIILITPWDTLLAVAKKKFPWLPVRLLLTDTYDTVRNLKMFPGRIAVLGAERDEVIPVGHAEKLYQTLAGPKKFWIMKGAGHNDWPDVMDFKHWKEITEFIRGEFIQVTS